MLGSKLDPLLFIIFINDLLIELESHDLGVKIGELEISSLSFADDIILIVNSPKTLQKLIDICGNWTRSNGMNFNVSKCKVMTLNVRKPPTSFHLLGEEIDFVNEYCYTFKQKANKFNHTSYFCNFREGRSSFELY